MTAPRSAPRSGRRRASLSRRAWRRGLGAAALAASSTLLPALASSSAPPPSAAASGGGSAVAALAPDTAAPALEAVLGATARAHPVLQAAQEKLLSYKAKLLSTAGAFDPKLAVEAGAAPLGKNDQWVASVGVGQQTAWQGLTWKGGYRYGADHPVYQGKSVTALAGDAFLAARLPLWQGRTIDAARATQAQAALDVAIEAEQLRAKRLAVLEKAGAAWVKWRVAGAKATIEGALLRLAEQRAAQIDGQVRGGALAEIVRIDNERLLASRRERLVEASRQEASAALALSMFWRDGDGRPLVPTLPPAWTPAATTAPPRVPRGWADAAGTATADGLDLVAREAAWRREALALRPEPRALELMAARAEIDLQVAANDRQPGLDLEVDGAWGLGQGQRYDGDHTSKTGPRAGARLVLQWPWPMRKARGAAAGAAALRAAALAERQAAREEIAIEVADARLAVEASQRRVALAQQAAAAARALEEAERRRFSLGQSDLVIVNLRETATADAMAKEAEAWGAWQLAALRLRAATTELDPTAR